MEHNRDEDVQKVVAASHRGELGLADLFHTMFKEDFVYLGKEYGWYAFQKPLWIADREGSKLIMKMNNELNDHVGMTRKHLKDEEPRSESDIQVVSKMYSKLQHISFKLKVVRLLRHQYEKDASDWLAKLDSNTRLIGFDDCVFDFNENRFREGLPSDMISLSTGHRRDDMVIREDICKKITTVLNEMHESQEVSQYLLHYLSTSLVGNPKNCFQIWTGMGGANGRSLTKNLVASAFGGYYYEPSPTLFTRMRTARWSILKLKGKRVCMSVEYEPINKIRQVFFEHFIKGYTIRIKDLQLRCNANIVMLFDKVPRIEGLPGTKASIQSRMEVVNFGYNFVDVPRTHREKTIDRGLHGLFRTKEYGACFLAMLMDMFAKHGINFKTPVSVKTT